MMIEKKENLKRVQITLRPQVLAELDRLADEWGTTRSGMITILTKLRVDHDNSELLAEFVKDKD